MGRAGFMNVHQTAFIWREQGGLVRLRDYAEGLGISLPGNNDFLYATGMSADGTKIVGAYGQFPGGFFIEGQTAYLLDLSASPCGFTPYGEGLAGANVLSLDVSGGNHIGATFTATTTAHAGSAGLTVVAKADASVPLLGGTGLLDASSIVTSFVTPVVGGTSSAEIRIPPNPLLVGRTYYLQSFGGDVNQPAGIALSNGIALKICLL